MFVNNGLRFGENNGGKLFNGDRVFVVFRVYIEYLVYELVSFFNIRKNERRNLSKSICVRSFVSNELRIEENDGCSLVDGNWFFVVFVVIFECLSVKLVKFLGKRLFKEIGNLSKCSSVSFCVRSV